MKCLGDFDTSAVIYGKFTTFRPSTGAAYTLGGTPALSVYKDNSTTQSTTGVTLTADFDSVTGLNHFAIDTSADGTFYSAGSFFDIVITTGTVDSVSVVGSVVASFTLRKTSALKPTTAGRTLDVSAGGEAGIDWANVGTPSSTVSLTNTTIATVTTTTTATNVTTVNGIAAGAITAAAIATDAIDADALAADAIAEINATVDTALADVRLDELLAADSDIDGAAPPTVGSVFHELMTKTAGSFTYDQTTDSLEAIRDKETDIETDTQDIQSRLPAALGANGNIKADVRDYNGTAGTFSGGRPEVNTSHWGGTAVASALVRSNLIQVGGSATPVTNLGIVFETDFAFNYNTDLHAWTVNTRYWDAEAVSGNSGCPFVDVSFFNSQPITATSGVNLDRLDAAISSRMATYTQPTGFLAATFPTTVASTTNITAGTITTVSGNVNGSVGSVTGAVGSVTGNVGGNVVGSVASVTGAVGSVTGNVGGNVVGSVASVTGNVGGNVVGTIGGLTAAALADFFDTNSGTTYASAVAGSVVKEITDNAGGGGLTVGAIADGVWDEELSGHLTAGTTGNALNAAGSAGDPWSTTLPGSYTGTQAGFVFGTLRASNLNILSPFVAEDNSLELVIGDDYYAADNRNLQFTYGASPSLSGATVYLDIQTDKDSAFEGTNITSTTGSVSGTTTQLVSFDLPGTTTDDFDEGWRAYRVRAVLSNSHTVTLTRGRLNMLSRGNDAPV